MKLCPETITQLVQRFRENKVSYLTPSYNETQLRREFLDSFFGTLGWDMENRQGFAEAYKEVIHEDSLKVGTENRAPDYCFRIGGTRKFFVEAKKPSVNLKDDPNPAFQLRRYAWSAKLPLGILTDFQEFAVYDCRVKPSISDKPSVGRILYLTYDKYEEEWDKIESVFSKDAILKGAFDKYSETSRGKRGTAEVDNAFLEEIESWRKALAQNIAIRNTSLSQRDVNFAVQRTIDRIIFLRICEDRGIEHEGALLECAKRQADVYGGLCDLFRRADSRYNSGLFHFAREAGRAEAPDTITIGLEIDDKILKDIIEGLYYPECPYEFSVLPANILGQVYEQFLGKVIRLTPGHQARIDYKPEVKKAGGVYYTPGYIVDYIVENTVGKLLMGKTPKEASQLKVLDPACGSGSFLIGAYQYLLNWHRDWYVKAGASKSSKGKSATLCQSRNGEWRLTIPERRRILLDNIHGVDIDTQAVEVTKLSLLLKVLEGENEQSVQQEIKFSHERALPDLGNNIKCGNSLIGTDFYDGKMIFEDDETYRINAFDWEGKDGFPTIMQGGGFHAIIGNPPYIRIQAMKEWAPTEVEFYKNRYKTAIAGNYDIYVVFAEKGLCLLNDEGVLGYILPHKFFNAQYGEGLRKLIAEGRHLSKVVHFGDEQIFSGATTYTCLLFLKKSGTEICEVEKVEKLQAWRVENAGIRGEIRAENVTSAEWIFAIGQNGHLFGKLSEIPLKLMDVTVRIFQGIKTSADKIYIVEEFQRKGKRIKVHSRAKEAQYWVEADLFRPLIKGGNSKRYFLDETNLRILFPYQNGKLISDVTLQKEYPLTWAYLNENKRFLEDREDGKMRIQGWYGYVYPKALEVMALPKLFTPDIAARSSFSLDELGETFFTGGVSGGYGILVKPEYSREYILGLLNSRLLEWYVRQTATQMRGGYFSFESRFIRGLPIRTIDSFDSAGKAQHDRIVQLVEIMLESTKKFPSTRNEHEKTILQRQIDGTDKQIDEIVYRLYGLTEEEIGIVEGEK